MSRPSALMAQPQVISTTPAHQATGVSLTTTNIDVSVNYPIVLSKLDTIVPSKNHLNQQYSAVYLVDKIFFDTLQGNINKLRRVAKSGTIAITNDSTVRLTLNSSMLQPGKKYVVLVDSLYVRTPNGSGFDTVVVSQHTFTFSTVPPPYQVSWSNFEDKNYINCRDTLKVFFNRKLQSHTTDSGSIVTLKKIQSRTYQQDSILFTNNYVSSSCTSWLSPDSMAIYAIPSHLNDDTSYYVVVNTHYLTGNTDDDVSYGYRKATHATVYPSVSSDNLSITIPEDLKIIIGDRASSIQQNEILSLNAPPIYENLYFKRWESQTIPAINNVTSNVVSTIINCGMLKSLDYKAVYSKMTLDTVELSSLSNFNPTSSNGNAKLTVTGFADSLGNGVYTVVRRPNSFLTITVVHDSGFVFNGWTSTNYPPVNGITSTIIYFIPGTNYLLVGNRFNIGNIGISPWGPVQLSPCDNYSLTVKADGRYTGGGVQPADLDIMVSNPVIAPTGPYSAQAIINNSQPFTQNVTFSVTSPCHEIKQVYVDGRPAGVGDGITWSQDIRVENPCDRVVSVILQPIKYNLTIEHQSSDQSKVKRLIQTVERSLSGKHLGTTVDPNTGFYTSVFEYNCGDVVDLTPKITSDLVGEIQFDEWFCSNEHTCDPIVDQLKHTLRVTMDEDKKVRFLWKQEFFLTEIHVYAEIGDGDGFRKFEVNKHGNVIEPDTLAKEIAAIKEFSPDAPVFRFQFSHDADESTLGGDNPNNAGLYITEDEGVLGTGKSTNCHDLATYYYVPNSQHTRKMGTGLYEMDLVTANGSIRGWKAQKFEMFWNTRIKKSQTNASLRNPGRSVTQTILPEVKVEVVSFTLLNCNGNCASDKPAVYASAAFVKVTPNGITTLDGGDIKATKVGGWSDASVNNPRSINSEFDQYKPKSRRDRFVIGFVGMDVYCGDDTDGTSVFSEFTDAILDRIKNTKYENLEDKLSDYAAYLLTRIIDKGPGWGCSDESYGSIQKIANFGDQMWMGRNCSNTPYNESEHKVENNHFKVKYKIKLK
ncbi:MAG: hypothetical protein IPK11_07020 [Ignavibacteria bacterium]|nr:hypothetical protein [Ignavibacteria bacterium]